jgi:hypothetical protein
LIAIVPSAWLPNSFVILTLGSTVAAIAADVSLGRTVTISKEAIDMVMQMSNCCVYLLRCPVFI